MYYTQFFPVSSTASIDGRSRYPHSKQPLQSRNRYCDVLSPNACCNSCTTISPEPEVLTFTPCTIVVTVRNSIIRDRVKIDGLSPKPNAGQLRTFHQRLCSSCRDTKHVSFIPWLRIPHLTAAACKFTQSTHYPSQNDQHSQRNWRRRYLPLAESEVRGSESTSRPPYSY